VYVYQKADGVFFPGEKNDEPSSGPPAAIVAGSDCRRPAMGVAGGGTKKA